MHRSCILQRKLCLLLSSNRQKKGQKFIKYLPVSCANHLFPASRKMNFLPRLLLLHKRQLFSVLPGKIILRKAAGCECCFYKLLDLSVPDSPEETVFRRKGVLQLFIFRRRKNSRLLHLKSSVLVFSNHPAKDVNASRLQIFRNIRHVKIREAHRPRCIRRPEICDSVASRKGSFSGSENGQKHRGCLPLLQSICRDRGRVIVVVPRIEIQKIPHRIDSMYSKKLRCFLADSLQAGQAALSGNHTVSCLYIRKYTDRERKTRPGLKNSFCLKFIGITLPIQCNSIPAVHRPEAPHQSKDIRQPLHPEAALPLLLLHLRRNRC